METQSLGEDTAGLRSLSPGCRVRDEVCSAGFGKNWSQPLGQGLTGLLVKEHCWMAILRTKRNEEAQRKKEQVSLAIFAVAFWRPLMERLLNPHAVCRFWTQHQELGVEGHAGA